MAACAGSYTDLAELALATRRPHQVAVVPEIVGDAVEKAVDRLRQLVEFVVGVLQRQAFRRGPHRKLGAASAGRVQ